MLCPHTFCPCTIHPRTLSPDIFLSLHVSFLNESQPTELHQPVDWFGHLADSNLTLDMVSHDQQNSINPWIGWPFSLT
jgi:hypothetical protein